MKGMKTNKPANQGGKAAAPTQQPAKSKTPGSGTVGGGKTYLSKTPGGTRGSRKA